ncbi:MAG: murein biosynthesis integral membrane protein MurJ [Actinomycetota bacterium]|nr:murein biosynthesis integral membrane protein MurJ [Actinomycetota bacterium]
MAAILRPVLSMSAATALSRITGYARIMTQAATLGTGVVANAYTLSNALPTQIYELFMGGLLSSIFVPLLVERLTRHGEEDARRLTNALLTLILPFLGVVVLLGIFFAEPLVALTTAWGPAEDFSRQEAQRATSLAVLLFRVFALQILFYGVGALATGVLQSHRRFFLPTFAPVLNNLTVIASFGAYALLVGGSPVAAIYALAFGTTLGVALMSLVLVPAAWRLGYRPRPALEHPALLAAVRLAGWVFVFVAATVGVQVVANLLGSRFGGVEKIFYAFVIFQLPYGVFVVAIATALMPELSERFTRGDRDGFRENLSFGLRTTAFVAVPASVALVVLAEPIVGLLYERGEFGPQATQEVAALLAAYSVGLLGYAASFVLARSFYSRQNAKIPALLNVALLASYVALAYALSRMMALPGVALAFSGAYTLLALTLLAAMRREIRRVDGRRLARSLTKILAAGAAMYAVAWGATALVGVGSGTLERLLILAVVGGASLAAYLVVAFLLKVEELRPAVAQLRPRAAKGER